MKEGEDRRKGKRKGLILHKAKQITTINKACLKMLVPKSTYIFFPILLVEAVSSICCGVGIDTLLLFESKLQTC